MRENGEREGVMWERDCADAKGTLLEERLEEDMKEGHFLDDGDGAINFVSILVQTDSVER